MERQLTHYYLPDAEPRYWIRLLYVTQDSFGKYYEGFGKTELPFSILEQHVRLGGVSALKEPRLIEQDHQVWLTPYGDVWLTKGNDPVADRRRVLLERGSNSGKLSKHEIIGRRADQRITFVHDHYLGDQPLYYKFTWLVAQQIATQFGTTAFESSILARWEVLADFMVAGPDFLGLAYFLHPFREHQHGIVDFATLKSYTFYFNDQSYLNERDYHPLFDRNLELHKRFLDAVKGNHKLRFGVIPNTAATIEIFTYFQDRDLHDFTRNHIQVLANIEELDRWLGKDTENHVAICDHNFAIELSQMASETQEVEFRIVTRAKYEHGTPRTRLFFRQPLPVGFAYPKEDERWAAELRKATAHVMKTYVFQEMNFETFATELRKKIAADLNSREEIRRTLGIVETDAPEEALTSDEQDNDDGSIRKTA